VEETVEDGVVAAATEVAGIVVVAAVFKAVTVAVGGAATAVEVDAVRAGADACLWTMRGTPGVLC